MAKFSDAEYVGLDLFVKEALRRVELGRLSGETAHSHIMHVLTAYDRGNETEVVPYMQMVFGKWLEADRDA